MNIQVTITNDTIAKMLCLSQFVTNRNGQALNNENVSKLCVQMAPLDVVVQKERWKASKLKGKCISKMSTFI